MYYEVEMKNQVFVLLLFLGLSPLWAAETRAERTILPNGLAVITRSDPSVKAVAVSLYVKAGTKHDPSRGHVAARLLGQLFHIGTEKRGARQILDEMEAAGGEFRSQVSPDWTHFYTLVEPTSLDAVLDVLADVMFSSKLTEKALAPQKKIIKGVVTADWLDRPVAELELELAFRVFENGYPVYVPRITAGIADGIEAATLPPVLDFYKAYYVPSNMVLVLVGDFKSGEALDKVKKHVSGFKQSNRLPPVFTVPDTFPGFTKQILIRNVSQPALAMGFRVPGLTHPDRYAVEVLAEILGSGADARLDTSLVKGMRLAREARVSLLDLEDQDLLYCLAYPYDIAKLDALQSEMVKEFANLRENGISEDDLRRAKRRIIIRSLLQREDPLVQAHLLGRAETVGNWDYERNLLENISKVSADSVQRVAATYFSKDNLYAVVFLPQSVNGPDDFPMLRDEIERLVARPPRPAERPDFNARLYKPVERKLVTSLDLLKAPKKYNETGSRIKAETHTGEVFTPYGSQPRTSTEIVIGPRRDPRLEPGLNPTAPPSSLEKKPAADGEPPKKIHLPLAMTLFLKEDHDRPFVTIAVLVKAGSAKDHDKPGLARLVARMLKYGTKRRSYQQIQEEFFSLGANLQVRVDNDFAEFLVTAPTPGLSIPREILSGLVTRSERERTTSGNLKEELFNFSRLIDLLGDLLSNPTFDPKALEIEKGRRARELRSEQDTALTLALGELDRRLYQGSPYERSARETIDGLAAIRVEDLVDFFNRYYVPYNTAIAVAGDAHPVDVARSLVVRFKDYGRYVDDYPRVQEKPFELRPPYGEFNVRRAGKIGLVAVGAARRQAPDEYPHLLLLRALLERRVARDLVYGTGRAFLSDILLDHHAEGDALKLVAAAGSDTLAVVKDELLREFSLLRTIQVEYYELDRVKTGLLAREALRQRVRLSEAIDYARSELLGMSSVFNNLAARIKAVKPEELRAVAFKQLDPQRLVTITLKPE
jgi:predicted Zn-dependent peptidase